MTEKTTVNLEMCEADGQAVTKLSRTVDADDATLWTVGEVIYDFLVACGYSIDSIKELYTDKFFEECGRE